MQPLSMLNFSNQGGLLKPKGVHSRERHGKQTACIFTYHECFKTTVELETITKVVWKIGTTLNLDHILNSISPLNSGVE